MNCKPHQLAWIDVPKQFARHGIEQLQGRVVRTIKLVPNEAPAQWEVEPEQWVTITGRTRDPKGITFNEGERVPARGIPDSFLRPFDPDSEPHDEQVSQGLELTS